MIVTLCALCHVIDYVGCIGVCRCLHGFVEVVSSSCLCFFLSACFFVVFVLAVDVGVICVYIVCLVVVYCCLCLLYYCVLWCLFYDGCYLCPLSCFVYDWWWPLLYV